MIEKMEERQQEIYSEKLKSWRKTRKEEKVERKQRLKKVRLTQKI